MAVDGRPEVLHLAVGDGRRAAQVVPVSALNILTERPRLLSTSVYATIGCSSVDVMLSPNVIAKDASRNSIAEVKPAGPTACHAPPTSRFTVSFALTVSSI